VTERSTSTLARESEMMTRARLLAELRTESEPSMVTLDDDTRT
jgi:hypothetical protein